MPKNSYTVRYELSVTSSLVTHVDAVRDLSDTLDLSCRQCSSTRQLSPRSACLIHHIRRLKQIRRLLRPEVTATVTSAFVLSKLDYCNAILAGLFKSTIAPLQRTENAAARLIALLASATTSQAPSYLTDIVTQTASVTSDHDFGPAAVAAMNNHGRD